ncbi:innexin inx2-like isoform X2 [Palaemon carinicauda]|uniref:innexin inx2-like isoform X2 n=1 Tax=Palaemon carinicauda TaxID=392227 RepID=UPI0035B5BFC4
MILRNQIDCMNPMAEAEEDVAEAFKEVVDAYCFIMGTFTVERHHVPTKELEYHSIPHPGVGPMKRDDPVIHHAYYQWVPFVLLIQGVLFYMPHWIWKLFEGGMFKNVIQNLSVKDYLGAGKGIRNYFTRETQYEALSKFIRHHMKNQRSWALKFFFCEFLNLGVVIGMIFFTNWFLGGEFLNYGASVIEILGQDPENRTDPMSRVFPKMTKCIFKTFGSSGTIQIHDVMCLIATNIINEKIYVFLWVWLIILTAVTSIWFIGRLLTIVLPPFRNFLLKSYVKETRRGDLFIILGQHSTLSEWLLLIQLARNMDKTVFSDFIHDFAQDLFHTTATLRADDVRKRKLLS